MSSDNIKLQISTPTEPIPAGRGFYQKEEEGLFVQVGQFSSPCRFFSYIESDSFRMDIDKNGKLIFMELVIPRKLWLEDETLKAPEIIEAADIRWMDFRKAIASPKFITNISRNILRIKFQENGTALNYYLGENIVAEVNTNKELTSIWITDIIDDVAGKGISKFRKNNRISKSYFIS